MDEKIDAHVRCEHVDGADDHVEISLSGRTLAKSANDADVIDHEDDSLSAYVMTPELNGDEDREGFEGHDLSPSNGEPIDDMRGGRRREPEHRKMTTMIEEDGSQTSLALRVGVEEQRRRAIASELDHAMRELR